MDYIEGNDIIYSDKNTLGEFLITNILLTGYIHGDLHSGNIKYNLETQQIILYDFGITKKISKKNIDLAYKLFIYIIYEKWCDLFIFLGKNFYTEKIDKKNFRLFAKYIYDPLIKIRNDKNSKMKDFINIMLNYGIKNNKIFNNFIPEIELAIISIEGLMYNLNQNNIWNISFDLCNKMNLNIFNNDIYPSINNLIDLDIWLSSLEI